MRNQMLKRKGGLALSCSTASIARLRSWVASQDNIPRGRTIPMGAVSVLARGLGHAAPTYLRRRPGSPSNALLGSALVVTDLPDTLTSTAPHPNPLPRPITLARHKSLAPQLRGTS